MRLKMELQKLQNAAALVELELQKKQITGTDDVSAAKRREIEIEIQLLKIKNLANEGVKDQIRAIEAEIQAIRNGTNARASGTSGINVDTDARYANAGAIRVQTEEMQKQAEQAARAKKLEGQNAVDATLMFKLKEKLAKGELTTADLADIKNVTQSLDQNREINNFAQANGMMSAAGVVDDTTWAGVNAGLKSAMQALLQQSGGGSQGGFGGLNAPRQQAAPVQAQHQPQAQPPTASQQAGTTSQQPAAPATPNATNLTINLATGVNIGSRADVEKLARAIMPAVNSLQRRGLSNG